MPSPHATCPVPKGRGRRKALLALAGLALAGVFALAAVPRLLPAPPLLDGVPFSRTVTDRNGVLLRVTSAADGQIRLRTPLEDVSPSVVRSLLRYEDRYFYEHPGVNVPALLRAAWSTLTGSRAIGASTVTMQTARMRLGLHTRTIAGKLGQIFWALRYEAHYEKAEILEAYLNLLPWGGNVAGIGAASLVHFGKPARQLTASESASLAVVPQNPVARRPGTEAFRAAHARFTARLLENADLSPLEKRALETPVRLSKKGLPFLSPHAADRALADGRHLDQTSLRITVDSALEERVRQALRTHLSRLSPYGIRNGAVMLLDARSGEILAEVGSADYFSDAIEGQVNGLVAPRSPGSTLKPFVYGLAFDQGLIHSETILFDTPRRFAAYEPENADGRFEGPVGAAKALRMSRNVPAVDLAGRISPDLYDFLLRANIKLPFPREHYGLSIVLGGAEVSPLNVAKLYAALHAGGRMTEPRLFADDPKAASVPLLSREAAWIVRAMLANPRNDLKRSGRTLSLPYKTGTSNGFRDAWTAGLVGPYVALVWLGNFDNAPNPHLLGEDAAAPLFKTVARLLASDPTYGRDVFQTAEKPEGVVSIDVCRATGDIPHGRCTDTVPAWFIPGKSPVRDTGVLREIWIDRATGLRACRWEEGKTERRIQEVWPARETLAFLAAGVVKTPPPPWMPGCSDAAQSRDAPDILEPVEGVGLFTGTASHPDRAQVVLRGVSADRAPLFWFDGATPLGVTKAGEPLPVELKRGVHRLTATDPSGRSASRRVRVLDARP